MIDNQSGYNRAEVADEYGEESELTKPEKAILELLKLHPARQTMLDIGVGGGRTTRHFAPLFEWYAGIDYSRSMVEVCEKNFSSLANAQFFFGDARRMDEFKNDTFDFILFSFNGIDCVNAEDRNKILNEIKRLGRSSSLFCFSTHNIFNVPLLFSFQYPRNPFKYWWEYWRMKNVRKYNRNPQDLLSERITTIIDGDLNFDAEYVYVQPAYQIEQLKELGFGDIRVFSHNTGAALHHVTDWSAVNDPWLYYLCTNKK